ncbi:MAG: SusC/RagA family TonB-linked outer membrane protein [Chitinophagaceae bacterium]
MRNKLLFACLLAVLISTFSFAQDINVNGRVTDEKGAGIAGATVIVKATKKATITNDDGNFVISARNGAVITVSYVGYLSKDYTVNGTTLNASLVSQSKDLNEVVVTALGIRKEKKALGYAITEVKGDELTQARSVNLANSLVGKVAGLNITSTATGPGGSSRIIIRGNTSITRNNQPLIVVDGIPFNNDLTTNNTDGSSTGEWGGADQGDGISSLNPDEIETISVLKGGTAAALYGSRASNGAILVTTKGGSKSGKPPVIEIGSNFVAESLLNRKIKDYQYEYGTGARGATGLVGVKPLVADPNIGDQTNSWGAKLDGSSVIQYDGVSRPYSAVTDNMSKFYKTGTTFTNNFAISGGGEKVSYRFSMSDLNNKGIVPNNTLVRDNVAMNINANLSKRFSILVNGKYIREKNKNRPRVSDSPGSANYTLWTLPTSLSVATLQANKYNANGSEKIWSNNQYVQNPYFATEDFKEQDVKDRFIGVVEPRFNLTDWLFVKGRVGFDKFNRHENDITPTGTGYQLGGGFNTFLRDFRETNLDLMLGIDKKLTNSFTVSGLVGGNRMKQVTSLDGYNGGPFNIPFFYDISNVSTPNRGTTSRYLEKRINSVYGSADLSYKNYLYLNLTGRNDWFSTLSNGANSIFYPSVGLSLILSDAFTMPSFVNYAKLRGSWAKTGGDTDPYQLALTYALTGATQNNPLAQINQSQVPNAKLQPYEVTGTEVGLEGRLFNNKLGIDLAVYSRKTINDIVGASISPASGYTKALFNIGEVTNKGIELLLSYKLVTGKDFGWDVSYNMGYNKSNVVQIYPGLDQLFVEEPRPRVSAIYQVINKPFAQILGNGFLRDKSGQVIFDAATGLPQTQGLKSFGSGVSPWTMGITNTFHYKQFGFTFLVDGKFGGFIYSGTNALAMRYGLSKATLPGRETGIVGQGVSSAGGANTKVVDAQTYYNNLYNFAEPFVFSSDFIKLRSIILDYSIPSKVFGKTPFKGATIGIVGRNLWTIMKHTPIIDPESVYTNNNAQGQEFAGLPATRTIGVNLNLKF